MDTLKIVKSPFGGYLGVYHTYAGGQPTVKVATSFDLLHWTFQANLAQDSSHADHLQPAARRRAPRLREPVGLPRGHRELHRAEALRDGVGAR